MADGDLSVRESFAEFHARLGGVPLDRMLMNPPPGTATEADLIAAWETPPHSRCELVDNTLIERHGSSLGSVLIAAINGHVGRFVGERDLGVCLSIGVPFRLRPGLLRVTAFSFTPWDRLPNDEVPDEKVATFVPALVAEVLSSKRTAAEIDRKVNEFFAAGCRLTWIIDPVAKAAKVYTSAKRFKELDAAGVLDGGKVLPGFRLPLADLFAATKRRKKKPR